MIARDLLRELPHALAGYGQFISPSNVLTLAFVALIILFFLISWAHTGSGAHVYLRPHVSYDRVKEAVRESAESGAAMHLSAGTGSVGASDSAETLAGVAAVSAIARRAANAHVPLVITTPSAVVLPLLQAEVV